jgi:hypothetical protein
MEKFRNTVISAWTENIKAQFAEGRIVYERQMQAELYHLLRIALGSEYEIWVEPVVYSESIWPNAAKETLIKPDLIITKAYEGRNEIIAVVELKCKPWEHPTFLNDCLKLCEFEKAVKENPTVTIPLGYKPVSNKWNTADRSNWREFTVNADCLMCLFVCAHPNSQAITFKNVKQQPENFMRLIGYFNEQLQSPEFKLA